MRILLLVLLLLLVTGCASNYYLDRSKAVSLSRSEKVTVYVTNPELVKEYAILKKSEIFDIKTDAAFTNKLKLNPLNAENVCGNPLLGSAVLLGAVPVSLPTMFHFSYELEKQGRRRVYTHYLPVFTRVSIWEWLFKRHKNKDKTLARALAISKATVDQP